MHVLIPWSPPVRKKFLTEVNSEFQFLCTRSARQSMLGLLEHLHNVFNLSERSEATSNSTNLNSSRFIHRLYHARLREFRFDGLAEP
jgi:hypothetical protein